MSLHTITVALWGFFIGFAGLSLLAAAAAQRHALPRLASALLINAAVPALHALVFVLPWPSVEDDALYRLRGMASLLGSPLAFYALMDALGTLKTAPSRRTTAAMLLALVMCAATVCAWLQPLPAMFLGLAVTHALGLLIAAASVRRALQGSRLAQTLLLCLAVGAVCIGSAALKILDPRGVPAFTDTVIAATACAYCVGMAWVLWRRWGYWMTLNKVLLHGTGHDVVTQLRSHAATGEMVAQTFQRFRAKPQPLGVIVVKLENLAMLQAQHGEAAANNALLICAVRLKRLKGTHVELGRLGSDGFLVIQTHSNEHRLHRLARRIHAALGNAAALNTALDVSRVDIPSVLWMATLGMGALTVDNPAVSGSQAVQTAQMMAQTALQYTSRMAWLDPARHEVVELKATDEANTSTARRAHVAAQQPSKSIFNSP